MHCTVESGICWRCGRFRRILRISWFPFEGNHFGCCPSARACHRICCTCAEGTQSAQRFCGSCCRICCILAFEGSCFSCGPAVRACLRSWCTCGLNTRSSKRFCGSCCRSRRTCCTHGICLLARSVFAHVLSMACSIWCTRCGRLVVRFRIAMRATKREIAGKIEPNRNQIIVSLP
jgi:hypothetical protein